MIAITKHASPREASNTSDPTVGPSATEGGCGDLYPLAIFGPGGDYRREFKPKPARWRFGLLVSAGLLALAALAVLGLLALAVTLGAATVGGE